MKTRNGRMNGDINQALRVHISILSGFQAAPLGKVVFNINSRKNKKNAISIGYCFAFLDDNHRLHYKKLIA